MFRLGDNQVDTYLNIQNKDKILMKILPNLKDQYLMKNIQLSRLLLVMGSTLSRQLTTKQKMNQVKNLTLQAMMTPCCKRLLHVREKWPRHKRRCWKIFSYTTMCHCGQQPTVASIYGG